MLLVSFKGTSKSTRKASDKDETCLTFPETGSDICANAYKVSI